MFRIQYAVGALLLAGAFGLIVPQANAQVYKGTFELPFETKWGGSVLEPGHYNVSIAGEINGVNVLKVEGAGGVAAILTGPAELKSVTSHGSIVLANVNGVYALRQFDAGAIGRSYSFVVPKTKQDRAATSTITIGVN